MSSSLQASSEPGKGSTFLFELVLADDDCETESEADTTDMWSEAGRYVSRQTWYDVLPVTSYIIA